VAASFVFCCLHVLTVCRLPYSLWLGAVIMVSASAWCSGNVERHGDGPLGKVAGLGAFVISSLSSFLAIVFSTLSLSILSISP